MPSFQKLYESLNKYREEREDPKISVYKSQNEHFWNNLTNLSRGGNIEGLAKLLNISTDQIRKWPELIRQARLEYENQQNLDKRDIMMPTGK